VTSPKPADKGLDEWVCEAIREALLKNRAAAGA
jgi:hypothetical protein